MYYAHLFQYLVRLVVDAQCTYKIYDTTIEYSVLFQTGMCPDGHYCPLGTGYPYTYPCQAGQYRNNTLGHSGEACVLCPSRHYCASLGTHTPIVCLQVFWESPASKKKSYIEWMRE